MLIKFPPNIHTLVGIEPIMYSRGCVYLAEDLMKEQSCL